jgi:hypothetical protein
MKNALLKFAGFFVERVPVDDGQRVAPARQQSAKTNAAHQAAAQKAAAHRAQAAQQQAQQQAQAAAQQQLLQGNFPHQQAGAASTAQAGGYQPHAAVVAPIAIALRAWVPQEYATHLAPHGIHIVAAGGEITVDQARTWGAQVLLVSSECLGAQMHLLQHPQLPTVFVAPQRMTLPDVPGVVQVTEPLRASEVAAAAQAALDGWQARR